MNYEVTFFPDNKKVTVRPGTTLLDASRRARVTVRTRCGGLAACLMCKVTVQDQSGLTPIASKEALKLGDLKERNIRLACQAKVNGKVIVEVPEDPLKAAIRAQLERQRLDDDM